MDISRKIFVSYKYKDWDVLDLDSCVPGEDTDYLCTPRHYVDEIIDMIGREHIYKGERGDEGMDDLSDDTIHSKLKEKIFDSSVTAVLISPRMKDANKYERDQWISREISYSLRDNKTMGERRSKTNAMLAIVLPDSLGAYDYAVRNKACGVREWQTDTFFTLLSRNMFNRYDKNLSSCTNCYGGHHHGNDHSYIHPVKWEDFKENPNYYIEHAISLRDRIEEYSLTKNHF